MIPFDGQFAQNYALPLAAAAYNEPWNSAKDPVLAKFTGIKEILVDLAPKAPTFLFGHPQIQQTSNTLLQHMLLPKGAGTPPTSDDVISAEGSPKPGADADAPVPPPQASDIAPSIIAPIAPAIPIDDRFGWMALDGTRLIVAIRGTQTPADWLHNFDFIPAPYLPIPGRGTVHQGFQQIYYAVRDSILSYVNHLKAAGPKITELLVVGHSLGGAIAVLAIPDILNLLPEGVAPILYNFAGPRAGHRDFATFFNSRINVAWRVVNVWDVVPHVPPLLAGYVHVGQQLTIDSGFHADVAANHVIVTGYVPGLKTWNTAHPPHAVAPAAPGLLRAAVNSLHGLPALAGVSD